MTTQHFDIITAQGMNATISLPNISGERFSITQPSTFYLPPFSPAMWVEVTPGGKFRTKPALFGAHK